MLPVRTTGRLSHVSCADPCIRRPSTVWTKGQSLAGPLAHPAGRADVGRLLFGRLHLFGTDAKDTNTPGAQQQWESDAAIPEEIPQYLRAIQEPTCPRMDHVVNVIRRQGTAHR